MKKMLVVLAVMALVVPGVIAGESGTRHLGNYTYINTDGPIRMKVNAPVAAKHLNRDYLMLVLSCNTRPNDSATVTRDDITLIYDGSEFQLPSLRSFRENYAKDMQDLVLLSREFDPIAPLGNSRFQRNVNMFPARNQDVVLTDDFSISYSLGARTVLYFKNPGIEKGETAVLQVKAQGKPEMTSTIEIKF